jgi:peptidyl-prolyl cis-trans isomerase D
MRRQRQNLRWVLIAIIFIIAGGLLVYLIPMGDMGTGLPTQITGNVARVGSESVSAREFQAAFNNVLRNMNRGDIPVDLIRAMGYDRTILNQLIMDRVATSEARRLGLSVSDEEVSNTILENPMFRDSQGNFIGKANYASFLERNDLTVAQYENDTRTLLLQNKLRTLVTASVGVSDNEVEEEYRNQNEKATLDYFVIEPNRLEPQVTASEQELKDHYEKNKATYNVSEKRQAKYLFFNSINLGKQDPPTDAELLDYYNQHTGEFRTAESVTAQQILFKANVKTPPAEVEQIQERARAILERARKGEDFDALARQFSEDASGARGGHTGLIRRGEMAEEFEKAVFAVSPGSISDVVRTANGFHIIKVNDKQNERTRTLEEVKALIIPTLQLQKGERKASDLSQQAALEAVRSKDINATAQKLGGEVKDTPLLERGDPIPGLGPSPDFMNQLFSLREKGDFGSAIGTPVGYVVVMLVDKQDPHPASFEEAKDRLVGDVKSQKARDLATQKGNEVQEQLKAGKDLRTVAKAVGAEIRTSQPITRGATLPEFGSLVDVETEIFSLPIGKTGKPASSTGRTLAFAVKSRTTIDPAEMKKSMDSIRGALINRKREEYFAAFKEEARKRMDEAKQITIDEKLLERSTSSGI